MNNSDHLYFAAKSAEECAAACMSKSKSFYSIIETNGYMRKLDRMWNFYYGVFDQMNDNDHRVNFSGEQGELVNLNINHFRNLATHIKNMLTASRPNMEAKAVNTDKKSLIQAYLANDILEYYMRNKGVEDAILMATEMALVMSYSFVKLEWNATSGKLYDFDPDSGESNFEGELEASVLSPKDVVFDGTMPCYRPEWVIVRSPKNRYNLIAKYPELEDKIRNLPKLNNNRVSVATSWSNDDTDDVMVMEFYHKKSEAIPNGRYMMFLDRDIVLLDIDLPYREIPIYRVSAGDILGTPYSYTPMFDLYPIQEAYNALHGIVMTNQTTFGVQSVFIPTDSGITMESIDGALNIIQGDSKPEPVNLTNTPREVFEYLGLLRTEFETISGVSSVTRGTPEASLRSASALALVQSMSLQFISGLQKSYVRLIENVGTSLINILKDFSNTPKMLELVGKSRKPYIVEFTGDAIKDINRVIVDMGSALSKSTAGRVQMAENLGQMGLLSNPQQYLQILNTGNIDAAFEGEMDQLFLIKDENERLLNGEAVSAFSLDPHKTHIMEHRSVFANQDLRRDPNLMQNALAHIQEHIEMLRNTDPELLQLINEQPLQAPNEMSPPPGSPSNPIGSGKGNSEVLSTMQQDVVSTASERGVRVPGLPSVDPALLANPQIQEDQMSQLAAQQQNMRSPR